MALAEGSSALHFQVSPTGTVQNYILDFVCFEKRLVIEIDGSQHSESQRDATREATLAAEGFWTLRYWNNDVLQQPASVLEDILAKLAGR
ncbi:very-short-patch-repair endonuclease [Bradyrhizobium ottawaense]